MAPVSIRLAADDRHIPRERVVLDHKADTAFRISCERPDIRLNKLDQVSYQHFKDFAAFNSSPAPCDVQSSFVRSLIIRVEGDQTGGGLQCGRCSIVGET